MNKPLVEEEVQPQPCEVAKCPECGEDLSFMGGCVTCTNCGYSKCDQEEQKMFVVGLCVGALLGALLGVIIMCLLQINNIEEQLTNFSKINIKYT